MDAAPAVRRRRLLLTIGFFFTVCGLPILLALWIMKFGVRAVQGLSEGRENSICVQRLSKLASALEAYCTDHDGRYPPALSWVDATWKYAGKKDPADESESVFRCPTISKRRTGEFGYAFNAALGGEIKSRIEDPGKAPLVFDSSLMHRNAVSGLETLPRPPRHESSRTNNAGFVGGGAGPLPSK